MKKNKNLFVFLVLITSILIFTSCGGKNVTGSEQTSLTTDAGTTYMGLNKKKYINKKWKCVNKEYVMDLQVTDEKFETCKKECREGNMHACANLSYLYRQELSIHANFKKAKELAERSCYSGVSFGCYNLGIIYEEGLGIRRDYRKAAEVFKKACEMGHPESCNQLAELYLRGRGVKKNVRKAVELMRKACKLGDEFACFNLKDYIRK